LRYGEAQHGEQSSLVPFQFERKGNMRMAETATTQSTAPHRKKTVFVADDHPLLRQGLTMLIDREPDLKGCGEAEGAPDAIKAIAAARPDILIADISLNDPDGLELLKNLRTPSIQTYP
jgi:PleD family two-component response regulator